MTTSSTFVTLLLQELARLLAEPLRPGFSQKYFTGGAAGAAAMLLSSGGAAAEANAQPGTPQVVQVADITTSRSRRASCWAWLTLSSGRLLLMLHPMQPHLAARKPASRLVAWIANDPCAALLIGTMSTTHRLQVTA
jgi:hypothetical protein